MFRVYDTVDRHWIKKDIYMSQNGELYILNNNKFVFNNSKLIPLSNDDRYICHRDIELYDKENVLVFEGDYIKAKVSEDNEEIGIVAYAHELSSYVILCVNNDVFYTLGSDVSSEIKVIGNVFDGYEDNNDDNKAL